MRAVKAHLGTSPFTTNRHAVAHQPRGTQRTSQRHAVGAEVAVTRTVVCYWHGCSQPVSARVGFAAPSLLAGEARDYCPRHTKQVAAQPGTMILARLRVDTEDR
jgi:hypothetical protein